MAPCAVSMWGGWVSTELRGGHSEGQLVSRENSTTPPHQAAAGCRYALPDIGAAAARPAWPWGCDVTEGLEGLLRVIQCVPAP